MHSLIITHTANSQLNTCHVDSRFVYTKYKLQQLALFLIDGPSVAIHKHAA